MDDARVWEFEKSLWTGDAAHYADLIDAHAVMALPATPFLFDGAAAVRAVADTPRWEKAEFSNGRIMRPQDGLIAIAYQMRASRGDDHYMAYCTSTYRRLGHDNWQVVQHSQLPELSVAAPAGN